MDFHRAPAEEVSEVSEGLLLTDYADHGIDARSSDVARYSWPEAKILSCWIWASFSSSSVHTGPLGPTRVLNPWPP